MMFRVDAATLSPFAEQLIKSLFGILTKPGSEENSHTMKGKINPFFFFFIIICFYLLIMMCNLYIFLYIYSYNENIFNTETTNNSPFG